MARKPKRFFIYENVLQSGEVDYLCQPMKPRETAVGAAAEVCDNGMRFFVAETVCSGEVQAKIVLDK